MTYSFRIRFNLPDTITLAINEPEIMIGGYDEADVILKSHDSKTPIEQTRALVLLGNNFNKEQEAQTAAIYYRDALISSFARLRIGADFGETAAQSLFFKGGLEMLARETGGPVLNDVHGLMIFEARTNVQFKSLDLGITRVTPKERFMKTVDFALTKGIKLSEKECIACDLFGTSFFQKSMDARFLMLMMAIETLLETKQRSSAIQDHITLLINNTQDCSYIEGNEKKVLIGALEELRNESIGQRGRQFVKRLGNRTYNGQKPSKFFTTCYILRSKLVHGNISKSTRKNVRQNIISLEQFVGDLLCGPLLSLELDTKQIFNIG